MTTVTVKLLHVVEPVGVSKVQVVFVQLTVWVEVQLIVKTGVKVFVARAKPWRRFVPAETEIGGIGGAPAAMPKHNALFISAVRPTRAAENGNEAWLQSVGEIRKFMASPRDLQFNGSVVPTHTCRVRALPERGLLAAASTRPRNAIVGKKN